MGKPNAPTTSYPDELAAAQATLKKSREVADTILPKNARSDLPYWFAELYYYITFYEIRDRNAFSHPAFVMHFIPIFYDMYAGPAQQFSASGATGSATGVKEAMEAALPAAVAGAAGWPAGMLAQAVAAAAGSASARTEMPSHWQEHFTISSQIVDPSQLYLYAKAATKSLVSGVTAHIKGDMAIALEKAYRTYTAKYSGVPPFDTYHPDFFEKNKPIFQQVRLSLVNELINRGMGFAAFGKSVNPEAASKAADIMNEGLKIDEIYGWRESAWQTAKSKLGS
jgi:hypothetical protein